MLVSPARSDERHQPRHRADTCAPHEAAVRATAVLCADQAVRHLGPVLRRQLKRHSQEVSQHGGPCVRLPLKHRPRCTHRLSCVCTEGLQRGPWPPEFWWHQAWPPLHAIKCWGTGDTLPILYIQTAALCYNGHFDFSCQRRQPPLPR